VPVLSAQASVPRWVEAWCYVRTATGEPGPRPGRPPMPSDFRLR
jgi:hypothetical protein